MKTKKSGLERTFDICLYAVLSILVLITLYPLIFVAFASISDAAYVVAHKGVLWRPVGINFEAYKSVFGNKAIWSGYKNTLFIIVFGVILNLFMTSLGAYVLSRKNVMLNKPIMIFIIITMFFNGGLIPFYLIVKGVGLLDTLWAPIVPFAINTFNLIILRTSFQSIPESLEEAAKIDGANHFVILFRIILPLSMPIMAVMTLYYAVDKWNGWFYSSIFISDRDLFPLQLVIREILISNSTEGMSSGGSGNDLYQIGETIKYATIMVSTLPILMVYPYLQRYFVKGVMVGSIKG
ncbi:carbohydrate ABC transporter permease [Paenibacillus sp. JSM ZJ436]|uniref:Binding-protein-dependent transporters inner membrane component n=1 Tax=Paenibacillus algicola TaxID=2565926 RepID=A0A4P8XGC0_9BACL|nr:carbohydrate ABC transporter permease [Paenibacillus algicola]QCT01492.1 binding-protein-dependent transporters inner membrane component [Paenibacillus algicola]